MGRYLVPLGERQLDCTLELYFPFYVIWGYHVKSSTTQTL